MRPLDSYKEMMSTRPSSLDERVLQYDNIIKVDITSSTTAMIILQLGLPHCDGRMFKDVLFAAYYNNSWSIVSKTWALYKVPVVTL